MGVCGQQGVHEHERIGWVDEDWRQWMMKKVGAGGTLFQD
jgi:hypothetical protein